MLRRLPWRPRKAEQIPVRVTSTRNLTRRTYQLWLCYPQSWYVTQTSHSTWSLCAMGSHLPLGDRQACLSGGECANIRAAKFPHTEFDLACEWLTKTKGHPLRVSFLFSCPVPQSARDKNAVRFYPMGSQHCSAVSRGDLARRSKFPYESPKRKAGHLSCFSFLFLVRSSNPAHLPTMAMLPAKLVCNPNST